MDDTSTTIGGDLNFPALWRWAVDLFTNPREFFRSMKKGGGYLAPSLYALAWLIASGAVTFVVGLFRSVPGMAAGRGAQFLSIFLGAALSLAAGFFLAAVFFVIWHLTGSKENYQTAFRVWAFIAPLAVVSAVLNVVPFLSVVAVVYGFYFLIVASQEVHGLTAQKSWAVWGSLCMALLIFLVGAFIVGREMRRNGMAPGNPAAPFSFQRGVR